MVSKNWNTRPLREYLLTKDHLFLVRIKAIKENPKFGLISYLNIMLNFKYGYQKYKVIAAAANGPNDAIVLESYDGIASNEEIKDLKDYLELMRSMYYATSED